MTARKISEFPPFVGKELLLAAQQRGLEITAGMLSYTEAAAITMIGLAAILAENNIGNLNEIVARMKK